MTSRLRLILWWLLLKRLGQKKSTIRRYNSIGSFWTQNSRRKLLILQLIRLRAREVKTGRRRWHVRPVFQRRKQHGSWYTSILNMMNEDTEKFFNYLRMTPERFHELLTLLKPALLKTSLREPISPGECLALTLRYLASGDSMISMSYHHLVGASTVSKIIRETCKCIWQILGPIVFEPISEDMWKSVASDFAHFWQFPNCIGAIDGKHCVVQKFARTGTQFYNYKGSTSIVLLAVCDAKYRFILVDIGARGRRSDGGVLASSDFGKKLFRGELSVPPVCNLPDSNIQAPHVLVGDEAFPLTNEIMRPFPGEFLDDPKTIFNYRLSRARRVSENAFGVLSARWRILRKSILASEITANAIVQATVCLHNFIMRSEENQAPRDRRYLPPGYVDNYDEHGNRILGRWRQEVTEGTLQPLTATMRMGARNFTKTAQEVREDFVDYFLDVGQVHWQWKQLPRRNF